MPLEKGTYYKAKGLISQCDLGPFTVSYHTYDYAIKLGHFTFSQSINIDFSPKKIKKFAYSENLKYLCKLKV